MPWSAGRSSPWPPRLVARSLATRPRPRNPLPALRARARAFILVRGGHARRPQHHRAHLERASPLRLELERHPRTRRPVILQREIPRVIHEILDALHDDDATRKEAGDRELFDVLMAARRSVSVQDQADLLRRHFIILLR